MHKHLKYSYFKILQLYMLVFFVIQASLEWFGVKWINFQQAIILTRWLTTRSDLV